MKETILVTGGYGFIGFAFIKYFKNLYKDQYDIINIDNCTYAAEFLLDEKKNILKELNILSYYLDIVYDKDAIDEIVRENNVKYIINFAAESHVDNSIKCPDIFIKTNVLGTQNLLDISKKYDIRFHQISTDEVYGSVDPIKDVVTEEFKYNPSSPYSSSKAAADLICLSYYKTFGTKVTISRCTNNYGSYQHPEKLIPLVISKAKHNEKIPVYGNGLQMRNWIYVDDHCDAICKILFNGDIGEIYNVGSATLETNIDVVKEILKQLECSESLIEYVKDRPAHDFAYHLNSMKIETQLNWHQETDFASGIKKTIDFYKEKI